MTDLDFRAPGELAECTALLAEYGPDAKVLAGGTALVLRLKQREISPRVLVSLQRVPGLSGVAEEEGGLRIGARTTLRELEVATLVAERFPSIRQTLARVATVRIRNSATVGGCVAQGDPLHDLPATLLALDASVRLAGAGGDRTVPLDAFYPGLGTTEIITGIHVPAQPARSKTVYLKYLPRTATDYPTVGVAARLALDPAGERIEDVRLALAGAAPTTVRAVEAEDLLRGQPPSAAAFAAAAAAVRATATPTSDYRGSAEYKREMAEVFVRRALRQALR